MYKKDSKFGIQGSKFGVSGRLNAFQRRRNGFLRPFRRRIRVEIRAGSCRKPPEIPNLAS
jgi:hypothetical protein